RSDISFYLKNKFKTAGSIMGSGSPGAINDWLAFYSAVPGYYNDSTTGPGCNSRYSVVAYRVNADPASVSYNRVERMGKGLAWNATSSTDPTLTPLMFFDNTNLTTINTNWPSATARSSPSPVPN